MSPPPLAIIQARLASKRLPQKMLEKINGKPLLWWAWDTAVRVFGLGNTVIACPQPDRETFEQLVPKALVFGWDGYERDVLGRFHACAHRNRTDLAAVIYRITPDDFPIDPFREMVTLLRLDELNHEVEGPFLREHIGYLMINPRVEINTQEDLERARLWAETVPMGQ